MAHSQERKPIANRTARLSGRSYDVFVELVSYRWAVFGEDRLELDPADFISYRTLSPVEFRVLKAGTCWDYVEFQRTGYLRRKVWHQIVYLEGSNRERSSHTIAIYKCTKKYIWEEAAWKQEIGRYFADDFISLVTMAVTKLRAQMVNEGAAGDDLTIYAYTYQQPPHYGMSVAEFMDYVKKNGRLLGHFAE